MSFLKRNLVGKTLYMGDREMDHWFRTLAAFAKNLGLVLRAKTMANKYL